MHFYMHSYLHKNSYSCKKWVLQWGLYSSDERDISAELEEPHGRMARIESECATEGMQLSRSVMEISDALVDLGMFPIRDVPAHLESASNVLTVASLILEHLREEHASDVGP
jgi:hypothetical protein